MSIWDLLTLLCFVAALTGSIESARIGRAGLVGYAVAVAVGLALGLGSAWLKYQVGNTVFSRLEQDTGWPQSTNSSQRNFLRVLYLAAVLWIFFVAYLAGWASLALLRLLK